MLPIIFSWTGFIEVGNRLGAWRWWCALWIFDSSVASAVSSVVAVLGAVTAVSSGPVAAVVPVAGPGVSAVWRWFQWSWNLGKIARVGGRSLGIMGIAGWHLESSVTGI